MKKPPMSSNELNNFWVKLHGRQLKKFLHSQAKRSQKERLLESVRARSL